MQRQAYCNEFSCSAFNNVSLVLGLTAIERIPLLFGYKDWFANVHLLVPQKECEECRCLVSRANAERVSCHCRDDFKDNTDHASISLAIESVVAMDGVRGVLFQHFDFWLNVRRFQDAPLDAIWTLDNGTLNAPNTPYCEPVGRSWSRSFPRHIKSWAGATCGSETPFFLPAIRTDRASGPKLRLRYCCWGWSDAFYLPSKYISAFSRLSVALNDTFLEVAVPTIVSMLEQHADANRFHVRCPRAATCCRQLVRTNWEPWGTELCGHKLGLDKPQYRAMLRRMLMTNWSLANEVNKADATFFRKRLKETGTPYPFGTPMPKGWDNHTRRCLEGPEPEGVWIEPRL